VCNQAPGIVNDKGAAGISDLDRSDNIPDQFEVLLDASC